MSDLNQETKTVLKRLVGFIMPPGMSPKERRELAKKAGISYETLRKNRKREAFNADTLVRLLMARGVSSKVISNLPQTELSKLPNGEVEWLRLGSELSDVEKTEFVGLLRFLRSRWKLK